MTDKYLESITRFLDSDVDTTRLITEKPDGNVHTVPVGDKEHAESVTCWCEPELICDYTDKGGKKLYLHREIQ